MSRFRPLLCFCLLLCSATLAAARGSTHKSGTSKWQTLNGNAPLVIARGGFSGLFADSSSAAYQLAGLVSLPNVIYWCDVQLTKDRAGICFSDLRLENNSDIANFFKNKFNTYSVNGVSMEGWFSVDFTLNDLANIVLIQGVYSRPNRLDGSLFPILTVQDLAEKLNPPGLWLNIQHDAFFSQQNLSMKSFILSVFRSTKVDYISSPEVNFLRDILALKPRTTKLIFRFLRPDEVEPSINQTYGSLLSNLTFIKTFASGILVPRDYIWPVDADLYLQPHTSVVLDSHKEGLEVFASDFANDNPYAYNFSYDPVAEIMSFIDNGIFSVDGVLSDFPITPSEAVACFSHIGRNVSVPAKPLVISYQGSSGDYPGCTDLAYRQAIKDLVDVLDCPVQMTKDGIPVCLGSINLIESTTVAQSIFSNLTTTISELEVNNGIFTFNLTWRQIQSLTPAISNPFADYRLFRNPKFKNAGKFMTLSEFLDLANNASSLSGVLINIEHAVYLAKQGVSVTDAVLDALRNVSHNNRTVKKVMIQSSDSSVLIEIKEKSSYDLVYEVDEVIRDADNSTITKIMKFANSVVVRKPSVFPDSEAYLTGMTDVVQKLQAFKLPVYIRYFRNEFVSQAWDFLSDPNVEINTFVRGARIDGVITDFPGTAAKYKRNRCLGWGSDNIPPYMTPVQPGSLMQLMAPQYLPPAEAPKPVLTESDVVQPPLPTGAEKAPPSSSVNGTTAPAPTPPNGQPKATACIFLSYLTVLVATLALF